jgi:hypothetical protein
VCSTAAWPITGAVYFVLKLAMHAGGTVAGRKKGSAWLSRLSL